MVGLSMTVQSHLFVRYLKMFIILRLGISRW
ncbi:unnamed protein product [Strongylus vulgaris]|uniref:Uncharacterized protein n=1 Tax=Strongylus vulgaris TaxID=40348 RepID=A0A3P7JNS5_STRVU|nr:unnamed protein product [Strongylus vulgaris]